MKLLLYCTKGKVGLYDNRKKITGALENFFLDKLGYDKPPLLNGKIVAECDFEVEEIKVKFTNYYFYDYFTNTLELDYLLEDSCLSYYDLDTYLRAKCGYAIHIKNLNVFNKPKELSDYYTFDSKQHININYCKPIIKAPQNMMYCWSLWQDHSVIGNRYFYKNILISIRPEYLCKILNGEKTIEVRKKVLKELENGNN